MPHATTSPPGTFDSYINYHLDPPNGEKYPIVLFQTAGARRRPFDAQPVRITDLRDREKEFELDVNGFQYVRSFDAPYEAFKDEETVKKEIYDKASKLLMKETGASHVHIFHHEVRREPHQKHLDLPKDLPDATEVKMSTPAMLAHVDQSYEGAKILINNIEATASLVPKSSSRWGVINIWRPLKTVTREPLAVCDVQTVQESDLREITYRLEKDNVPGKKGLHRLDNYLWQLGYSPEHRWYYKSAMTSEDAILIKCFDTKMDGRARLAPHSAIVTPMDGGPPRESIELRCLVFWEDQELEGEERQFVATGKQTWVPV